MCLFLSADCRYRTGTVHDRSGMPLHHSPAGTSVGWELGNEARAMGQTRAGDAGGEIISPRGKHTKTAQAAKSTVSKCARAGRPRARASAPGFRSTVRRACARSKRPIARAIFMRSPRGKMSGSETMLVRHDNHRTIPRHPHPTTDKAPAKPISCSSTSKQISHEVSCSCDPFPHRRRVGLHY